MSPKKHEYKFVVDGIEEIDPENPVFISNNIGGWNSILDLRDQNITEPGMLVKNHHKGNWLYFEYLPSNDEASPQDWIILLDNKELHPDIFDLLSDGGVKVNVSGFKEGLLRIFGRDSKGRMIPENQTIIRNGEPLSSNSDDWHFAIIYNIIVDRFRDGNSSNNKPIYDPKLHELANFMGGDFAGIKQKLDEGYFKDLGVNTLWISPIQKQPDSSWVEWVSPNRTFSGYHGYWPIEPRKIDPRFGNSEEFHSIVKAAHQIETKVILDFVSNHVHQDHSYLRDNRDWFGTVNLPDGRLNIRQWDGDTRLTTWFDEFLPSFDFQSAPVAINQVVEDAMWWMGEYDLDGFRQDAVKHVPHSFWKSLTRSAKIRFPEKNIYQIGETFGSDELIGSYVNPAELDAQFNFSIYFNSRGVFSSDQPNFSDLGDVIAENRSTFGPIHLMGNITSSHDQLRFSGYADGQIQFSDNGTARSFDDPVGKIRQLSTYSKMANFHAFNISQPGIPIIYYGEEIALMGEGDPGNRRMMRFNISDNEMELKKTFSLLNGLRTEYSSLALGDQMILYNEGPVLILLKKYFDEMILVAFNNSQDSKTIEIEFPFENTLLTKLIGPGYYEMNDQLIKLTINPLSHDFYFSKK
jgi:glycosidase